MIDKLVLRCNFRDPPDWYPSAPWYKWRDFDLFKLGIPLKGSIAPDRSFSDLHHRWESIPSSFDSLAFKFFWMKESKTRPDPYIEIKASPAKLMQGHNVFGTDDLATCAMALIETLCDTYPELVGMLDAETWEVGQIDVTYFSRAKNEREAEQFIHALSRVSRGHTRSRTGYATTAYFGKRKSRIKRLRVYLKNPETVEQLKKIEKSGDEKLCDVYSADLLAYTSGMIRWEAELHKRWFERRDYPTKLVELAKIWNEEFANNCWQKAFGDLHESIGGHEMRLTNDDKIKEKLMQRFGKLSERTGKMTYGRALAAYNSYRRIKADGYEQWASDTHPSSRSRHLRDLDEIGISLASLQQFQGDGLKSEVIPMIRFIEVDFGAQRPPWAA